MKNLIETATRQCHACNLGLVEYGKALRLLDGMVSARLAGDTPDTLLLLQHPPVITAGLSSREGDILADQGLLKEKRIEVFRTDRGGRVTYHGPGQLVVYPIFDLKTRGKDLHRFVFGLEEAVIRTLAAFSIHGYIDSSYPGVWVANKKVCSLGIRLVHWTTKHGLALNVSNDLGPFSYIVPCGIPGKRVTSMSQILGYEVPLEGVSARLLEQLADHFDVDIKPESPGGLSSLL